MNIISNFLEIKLPHFYVCLLLFLYNKIFLFYFFGLTINNLLKNIVIELNKRKGFYNNIHVYWEKTTVEGQYPPNWTPPKEVSYDDLLAQLNNLNEWTNSIFYFIPIFSLILVLLFFFFTKGWEIKADPETPERQTFNILNQKVTKVVVALTLLSFSFPYLGTGLLNIKTILKTLIENIKLCLPIKFENSPKGVSVEAIPNSPVSDKISQVASTVPTEVPTNESTVPPVVAPSPLEQFEILPWIPMKIGDLYISFTNPSLFMLLTLSLVLLLVHFVTSRACFSK